MNTECGFTQLIAQARLGDRGAMDCLAQTARQRLYGYIYRLTLNHDLAQDLLQETMLAMVEHIKDLKDPARFWCWLFRTGLGVVQHHYRDLERAQRVEFSELSRQRLSSYLSAEDDDGLNRLMRKELSQAVIDAMARMHLEHRHVLMLRCYEQMSYADIAETMGCKELRARVLCYRARRSLARRLARRGFGKHLLLTALGVFGLLTAPTDSVPAAGTVTAASLHVGPLATFAGAAGSAPGILAVVTIAGVSVTLTTEHFLQFLLLGLLILVSFVIALYVE